MKINFRFLLATCFFLQSISGCKKTEQSASHSVDEQISAEEREFARSALLKSFASDGAPAYDLSDLQRRGELKSLPVVTDFNANESVYSSLNSMQQYAVGSALTDAGLVVRVEKFALNETLTPGLLRDRGGVLPLNLSLTARSEIQIIRMFGNADESMKTPPYSLIDLPLSESNVSKMRVGDLIVIPLESQLMTAVDGAFIRSAANAGAPLKKLLGLSMNAHAGSGLRGNLIISGRFEMHLFKVDKNSIRVRFFEQSERSLTGGGSVSASVEMKYSILPLSKIHTVAELKKMKRVRFYGSPRLQLNEALHKNLNKPVLSGTAESDSFAPDATQGDGLNDLANQVTLGAELIQQQTTDRINALSDTINERVIQRINEPINKMKKYSDQEFNLSAAASWQEKRTTGQQFFSEYEFDLKQQIGLEAYLHAVSGASILIGGTSKILGINPANRGFHNLVPAERIAKDLQESGTRPVRCLLSASARSKLRDSRFEIGVGQRSRFSISENWSRESFRAVMFGGQESRSADLIRWIYKQGYRFGIISDHQARGSGFIVNASDDANLKSIFWYTRTFDWQGWSGGHLTTFFNASYNLLGPVAGSLQLADLFRGEVASPMRGRVSVALAGRALERIFDPQRTTAELVWQAAARVANSFDNTFGLPFIMFPMGVPAGVSGTSAAEHCDTITRAWGSFYCHFLAREFIPVLRSAQNSQDVQSQIAFFEAFLGRGFGANKIGGDLLARIMIELLVMTGSKLSPDELAVQFKVHQSLTSDPVYNPMVTYGNSGLMGLLDNFSSPE